MKNFLDNPITWRAYFKLCGVSLVLTLIYCICIIFRYTDAADSIKEKLVGIKEGFKKLKNNYF